MFPPENDEGNIEYKRHLCSQELRTPDDNYNIRFQQLVTQLKYRLNEGNGTAVYYIGVEDDGSIFNLTSKESSKSISTLKKMAIFLDVKITDIFFKNDYIKIVIKDKSSCNLYQEKRILLLGDTVNLAFVTAEARTPVSESKVETALAISRAAIPVLS